MHAMIFVNLPVADIERSRKFFTDLGYTVNETFSGDSGPGTWPSRLTASVAVTVKVAGWEAFRLGE